MFRSKFMMLFIGGITAVVAVDAQQKEQPKLLPMAIKATGMPDAYQPVKRLKRAAIGR